jgi:hypothetical protein
MVVIGLLLWLKVLTIVKFKTLFNNYCVTAICGWVVLESLIYSM